MLLIIFFLTNKTAKNNTKDLITQFLKMIHHWIEDKLNKPQLIEDISIDSKEIKEVKQEESKEEVKEEESKDNVKQEESKENVKEEESKENVKEESKEKVKEEKFEDKYLKKFKSFTNEYVFTDDENALRITKYDELKKDFLKTQELGLKETIDKINRISLIFDNGGLNSTRGIEELTKYYDIEAEYDDNPDDYDLQELINELTEINDELKVKYLEFSSMVFSEEEAREKSKQYILDTKLNGYINNYIIESTPLGNVYMRYNHDKKSFEYFSNNTIPYRFLEPVGRKYVMTYYCKPLFVDVEEELKKAQIKKDEKDEKDEKDKEEKDKEGDKASRNIFAKLKSYNKESGPAQSQMNSKNRQPNTQLPPQVRANLPNVNASSETMLLKENSNRYTWEGRIANLSILKKVERKHVDKNYEMSFADFKRLQQKK
jgi:X-linked retinitis pigmentosa GTPase regulator